MVVAFQDCRISELSKFTIVRIHGRRNSQLSDFTVLGRRETILTMCTDFSPFIRSVMVLLLVNHDVEFLVGSGMNGYAMFCFVHRDRPIFCGAPGAVVALRATSHLARS